MHDFILKLFGRGVQPDVITTSYQQLFSSGEVAQLVLRDLCRRGYMFDSEFSEDSRTHAFQSGKREIILEILTILDLTFDEIQSLSKVGREEEWEEN